MTERERTAEDAVSARNEDLEIVQEQPVGDTPPAREAPASRDVSPEGERAPLLAEDALAELRSRWEEVQAGFVDEPRSSVLAADQLVAEVMALLSQTFDRERNTLEQEWDRGEDVSTEDLRLALRRYRSFFDRLLEA